MREFHRRASSLARGVEQGAWQLNAEVNLGGVGIRFVSKGFLADWGFDMFCLATEILLLRLLDWSLAREERLSAQCQGRLRPEED